MSMSKQQKEAKLKASIHDFVGPLLKRLKEEVPGNSDMEKIITDVKKIKNHLDSRENWDRELAGFFGQIERQIDSWTDQKQVTIVGNESNQQDILNQLTRELISDLNFILDNIDKKLISDLKVILEQMRSKSPMDENGSDLPQNNPQLNPRESLDRGNQDTEGFMEFLECMKSLNPQLRNCLYSLAVFPEKAELKKRLVVYWWIGLGLVPLGENRSRTAEKLGEIFFSDLVDKGVLKPVIREHNQAVDRCTIKLTIHRQLISACKKKELIKDQPNKEGVWHIYGGDDYNLKALINRDQRYLDSEDITITSKRDMHVLQLGRWGYIEPKEHNKDERTGFEEPKLKDHIEVDKTDFLGEMGKNVTYLSLRGISRIEEVHESIGKLENLIILDLKACHNLEKLPQKPRSTLKQKLKWPLSQESWFKKLTHLDITECYLLDHMPKWICELPNLEVLKGFVVGSGVSKSHSCRLQDLPKLKKIRKLSIRITTSSLIADDFNGLKNLDSLRILTITWGEVSEGNKEPEQIKQGEVRKSENNKEPEIAEAKRGETSEFSKQPQRTEATGDNKKSEKAQVIRSKKDSVKAEASEGNTDFVKGEESEGNKVPEIVEERGAEASQGNKEPKIAEPKGGNKDSKIAQTSRSTKDFGKVLATMKDDKKQTYYFPLKLEKLDIRCYPEAEVTKLNPAAELKTLKRLYIRGGMIKEFTNSTCWPVETLRLRFLNELEIDWYKLTESFNNLKCVEYVNCPKLKNFPNDKSCWRTEIDGPFPSSQTSEISNQS